MKNLPIILKEDLTILETSKKGTLILNNDDYLKFGIETRPFNLSAIPTITGLNELIYEIKYVYKHSFSPSKQNVSGSVFVKIIDIETIKKDLEIDQKDLAKFFNMTYMAYANSTAKERYENALCRFYTVIKKSVGEKNKRKS